jgi:hypothetical protein
VLRITIHEGRNRQVRRMCEAIGHPVLRLVRTRIGPISDRSLRPGDWRELSTGERKAVTVGSGRRIDPTVRSTDVTDEPRRLANVIGLGLMGGSVALGLRQRGWHVAGDDASAEIVSAVERGIIDERGLRRDAEITFVAVPVLAMTDQVKRALAETDGVVTDIGSVKAPVCDGLRRPTVRRRASDGGQRDDGLDGADGEMFTGACGCSRRCRRHRRPGAVARVGCRPRSAPRCSRSPRNATTRWSRW